MAYRSDLDALTARKTALETEIRDRTRELEDTQRLVDELATRARLPVLDNLRVAAPCFARWEAMTGDGRVRACAECNKNVYNLSEMTRDEAESLILTTEGRLCVRYYQRADGTIMLKDCTVGVRRRRRRRFVAAGVAASLAGSALAYLKMGPGHDCGYAGLAAGDPVAAEEHEVVMGELAAEPPPPAPEGPPVPVMGRLRPAHESEQGPALDTPAPAHARQAQKASK